MSQDFKTTREIYEYLIAGGTVINKAGYIIFLGRDGQANRGFSCSDLTEWSKYIEPAPKSKMYLYDLYDNSSGGWIRTNAYYASDKQFTSEYNNCAKFKRRDADFIEVDDE